MSTASALLPTFTVRRPSGAIETTTAPLGVRIISEEMFRLAKQGTAKAGRGEVLSYTNPQRPSRDRDHRVRGGTALCPRCDTYCCGDCS